MRAEKFQSLAVAASVLLLCCGKASDQPKKAKEQALKPPPPERAPTEYTAAFDAGSVPALQNCTPQPFALSADLAEASGATMLSDGSIMVVGDSGTNGSFVRLNATTGDLLSRGQLALDRGASDDLEGLSRIGDTLYAITSSGHMRHFLITSEGFEPSVTSYALANESNAELLCQSAHDSNCGPNYEGLCLRHDARADAGCAGFAASKANGTLLCLRLDKRGRLALDPSHSIPVAKAQALTGCDFDTQNRLWFGTNFFALNRIGFVEDWNDLQKRRIVQLGAVGVGFCEAIVAGPDDEVFRFSDTSGSPSLLSKYICR